MSKSIFSRVALLAEGVGRNNKTEAATSVSAPVALLTEGVDRNGVAGENMVQVKPSSSLRRAWIEMVGGSTPTKARYRRPPRGGRG